MTAFRSNDYGPSLNRPDEVPSVQPVVGRRGAKKAYRHDDDGDRVARQVEELHAVARCLAGRFVAIHHANIASTEVARGRVFREDDILVKFDGNDSL